MTLLFSSTLTSLLILVILVAIVVSLLNRRVRRRQTEKILDALAENTATVEEMRKSALAHGYIRPTPKLVDMPKPRREKKHLRLLAVPLVAAGAWVASTVRRRPEVVAGVASLAVIAGVTPMLSHTQPVDVSSPPPTTSAPARPTPSAPGTRPSTPTLTPTPSSPTLTSVAPTSTPAARVHTEKVPTGDLAAVVTVPHTSTRVEPPAHTTHPQPTTTQAAPKPGRCLVHVGGRWILELSLLCR